MKWTRRELEEYQAKSLNELRSFAYQHSPFYQNLHQGYFDKPLNQLPVVTKTMIMEHWDEVVTDRKLKLKEVEEFISKLKSSTQLFKKKYYISSTSGSTGLKGVFLYSQDEWYNILASYSRAYDWAGLEVGLTKRLKMAVVSSRTPWHQSAVVGASVQSFLIPTIRIDSTENIEDIVAKLNKFQPESLVAYANMAKFLAEEQLSGTLKIHPEAVFCASEVLTEDSKRKIRRAWGKEPFNVYAATETAGIASETREHRGMALYEDLVIIEVVDSDYNAVPLGSFGEKLLVTVLYSRTVPLIRYEMSDSVSLLEGQYLYGPFKFMKAIQGRREDILAMPDTKGGVIEIQPNFFHNLLEKYDLGGWQIVQEEYSILKLLIYKPQSSSDIGKIAADLKHSLEVKGINNLKIDASIVKTLKKGKLGKTFLIKGIKRKSKEIL